MGNNLDNIKDEELNNSIENNGDTDGSNNLSIEDDSCDSNDDSVDAICEERRTDEEVSEYKTVPFNLIEAKEVNRKGTVYGIVEGYASTFGNVDRVGDVVDRGAFLQTILDHQANSRPVRMFYQHDSKHIIGGFSPFEMFEDENGLKVRGEINLDVQKGKEAYALAKQGVLTDFSIGYNVVDSKMIGGNRHLTEVNLWEISLVGEPANPKAKVTQVKSTPTFKDYEVHQVKSEWNEDEAVARLREFSGSETAPSEEYKNYFLYCEDFSDLRSYKLPFVDVVNGQVKAVESALINAVSSIKDGFIAPKAAISSIKAHIAKYYKKLDLDNPFKLATVGQLKEDLQSKRDVETFLRDSGLSRSVSLYLASLIDDTKLISNEDSSREVREDNQSTKSTQCDIVNEQVQSIKVIKQPSKKKLSLINLKSLIEKL